MQGITLTSEEVRKLLSCGCSDAVTLYLYRKSGRPLETALDALHFQVAQMQAASDCLRYLGMWEQEAARPVLRPERPNYSEFDVAAAMRDQNNSFSKLVGEAQRRLGRTLSTEELKILLSFTDYLRLPGEVVGLLLSYCVERCRKRGMRAPSMRTIEKEAYRWADEGIDNLEAACQFVQHRTQIHSRIQQLRQMMQIDQRRLTPGEEKYLTSWIEMGFTDEVISMAYERTCMGTGGLKWHYMNTILTAWNEKGLRTPQDIALGDTPKRQNNNRNTVFRRHNDALSPLEQRAVEAALAEGQEG